jgi:hypothetical protein
MSWPFDHHLAAVLPCLKRQFPLRLQFGELDLVVGIGEAAGAQAVAEAEGHVVGPHDFAEFIEVGVPEILLAVGEHPDPHERSAPADDAGDAVARQRQVLTECARMDRSLVQSTMQASPRPTVTFRSGGVPIGRSSAAATAAAGSSNGDTSRTVKGPTRRSSGTSTARPERP